MDDWRSLLYPLGFLSSLAFGARFIVQWLESERVQQSVVSRSFWYLSLAGNLLLAVHSLIQVQFHLCIVQTSNAVISWRNLDLLQVKRTPAKFKTIILLILGAIVLTIMAFYIQDLYYQEHTWFRVPLAPWQKASKQTIPFFWHLLGTMGYWLFSSRFWIQWWLSEKANQSLMPPLFWWISLVGATLSIIYFSVIGDSVNLIGPLLGLIPYIRNLIMIKQQSSFR
jgi:lipid-A-disaccharide synthase-like uncharacterized protein